MGSDGIDVKSLETPAGNQKKALKLLERMARTARQPEHFTELCVDWAALPKETIESEEFTSTIDNILMLEGANHRQISEKRGAGPAPRREATANDVIEASPSGRIQSISPELADILGRAVGDSISAPIFDLAAEGSDLLAEDHFPYRLTEITDRFGVNRLVHFSPVVNPTGEVKKFIAYVPRRRIPEPTLEYLRSRFSITPSESEIINLVLQRYRPEQIAELRNISVNTVRTHVNRVLKKLGCRSLTETVAYIEEISDFIENHDRLTAVSLAEETKPSKARIISLPGKGRQVEYLRFGSPSHQPVIILHSLEYGFLPPSELITEARERGFCLYFPLRAGFGATTQANSLADAGAIMDQFIETLDLRDAHVIALSMAAPTALHMRSPASRIHSMLIVNYALNAQDKIGHVSPTWVKGFIRFGLTSPKCLNYSISAIRALIRMMGPVQFYRRIYAECDSDLEYLERHADDFKRAAENLLSVPSATARMDIESSFLPIPGLSALISKRERFAIANGETQHAVPIDFAAAEAQRAGVQFFRSAGGRNWAFQHPATLFEMLEKLNENAEAAEQANA